MKTEFDFDTSKLFGGHPHLCATVKPMDFPFLIAHAFDNPRRTGVYVPEALSVVLTRCCELIAEDAAKPEHLRDMLVSCIKADGSETGIRGLGNLELDKLFKGSSYVSTTLAILPNANIQIRRYGDCLGIRATNDRHEPHEKLNGILTRLTEGGRYYVHRFNQRYSFTLTPELKGVSNAYVFDVQKELATMDRYLPDIKWAGSKRLAADLGGDFTGRERTGVKVGVYGDAEVFARIVYERETDDPDWRLGKVRSTTATELMFGAGAGDKPQIQYFIEMAESDRSYDPARRDIDYQREQGLLHGLARMFYTGLYQREFQSSVRNGSESRIRFRREPEKAVA